MKPLRAEFADTMLEVGKQDPSLVVMVGDISHGILQPFAKECPGRYFNVGICEPTIVNMAAGVAKSGLVPVIHTIAPFIIERAYEQIKLDFGYQNLSGNFISVGSAFDYAQLGCSHHCYADVPLMMQFARAQIFFPGSPLEFNLLFKQAYRSSCINYFRLPEKPHGHLFSPEQIALGKGIVVEEGQDLTIVALGPQLKTALEAGKVLRNMDVFPEILYFPTLKPFDRELVLQSVKKTRGVMVIEEISSHGGIYSLVVDTCKSLEKISYSSIAIHDFIHSYGTYEELCEEVGLSVEGILRTIEKHHPSILKTTESCPAIGTSKPSRSF